MIQQGLRLLANLGLGMALGGAVRGLQGARRLIPAESDVAATRTAASQLQEGKSVRTDEILKDGLYRQALNVEKGSPEARALSGRIKTKLSEEIHSQEAQIGEEITRVKTRTVSTELRKPTKAPEILKQLETVNKVEKLNLTPEQRVFLDRSFKTEELSKAKAILEKPGFQRNADEIRHLRVINQDGGEEKILFERLQNQDTKIRELEAKIKDATPRAKPTLEKELEITKASSELGVERLNQLKSGFSDKRLADKHVKLQATKRALQEVDELLTTQDVLNRIDNMDKPPVTPDELTKASSAVRSAKNSASYSETSVGALEDELKGAPKSDEKVLSDAEKNLRTYQVRK